jgi:trk system potassium uptake protein
MMTKEKNTISGYALVLNYLGSFSILIGLIILTPLMLIIFWSQERAHALYFVIPAGFSFVIGLITMLVFKGKRKGTLAHNHDAVLVVGTWFLAILLSSLPFLLSGQLTFTESIFEAASGYSTTGLTVVDVENMPHVFLFFRSLMQFFGGVGLVLLITSFISNQYGMRLYSAEGHGDKLVPNLLRSARTILSIYLLYIILGVILYVIFDMPVFDAINHSISAVATGGFSVKAESIGYYNSLPIEIITMILMVLGGTNFFVHLLIMKRKFKLVFRHIEVKFLGLLSLFFIPIFVISLIRFNAFSFTEALRVGTFHYLTTITTTGLQTVSSIHIFPTSLIFAMLILMMIGAGMGSTAGGMKLYRVALAFKSIYWHIRDSLSHKKLIRPRFINRLGTNRALTIEDINENYTFLIIYLFILFIGITIFTFSGYTFQDSIFEFTSTLGTIGLSTGIIGSNPSNVILWTGVVGMLIARLESYVVIIAITKVIIDTRKTLSRS